MERIISVRFQSLIFALIGILNILLFISLPFIFDNSSYSLNEYSIDVYKNLEQDEQDLDLDCEFKRILFLYYNEILKNLEFLTQKIARYEENFDKEGTNIGSSYNGAKIVLKKTSKGFCQVFKSQEVCNNKEIYGPSIIIDSAFYPGKFWAMNGSSGVITIEFITSVIPKNIVIEHIHYNQLMFKNSVKNSIKEFSVEAMPDNEKSSKIEILGNFSFNYPFQNVQKFQLAKEIQTKFISLVIKNNNGNPLFTTIYHVKVIGSTQ